MKFILDAGALHAVDPKLLGPKVVITPHAGEFKELFGVAATKANVAKMAKRYGCIIVLKGREDIVSNGVETKVNQTGNTGMTKGGTGDVLAGLTAALSCSNDPYLAACAAVFLNGLAGDRLREKVSYYYNASDLIREIPKARKWCEGY
jgi:NAD(P)H-hydrate epimerase